MVRLTISLQSIMSINLGKLSGKIDFAESQ